MASTVQADTTTGPVVGFVDTFPVSDRSNAQKTERGSLAPVRKWLGVPFAKAERWARPTPPPAWSEPLECFEFGPYFPQPPDLGGLVLYAPEGVPMRRDWSVADEHDAFRLNIFTPDDIGPNEKLPILIWIYGGGLVTGLSSDWVYDPTSFIRREAAAGRRLVVVTANYRLNVLGFLASRDLVEVDPDGLAGNYGLYDCIAFLQWVQDNIASFGGDPANVLMYGESAGAFMCSTLTVHPRRLCRHVVAQSGSASLFPFQSLDHADSYYQTILAGCGITNKTHPTAASRVEALRGMPWEKLALASSALPGMPWSFVIESGRNAIWTEHTQSLIQKGRLNPSIRSMTFGMMKEEGNLFLQILPLARLDGWPGAVKFFRVLPRYDKLRAFYGLGHDDQPTRPGSDVGSAFATGLFYAGIEHFADALVKHTSVAVAGYEIEASIGRLDRRAKLGPTHSVSLPFLFNSDDLWDHDESTVEGKTSKAVGQMLTDLAIKGKASNLPPWKANKALLVFSADGSTGQGSMRPMDEERAFWIDLIEGDIRTVSGA